MPPEIIVGIIGVETRWGRVMGKTRILDALATLAFDYPRRADFFTGELEAFLVMTRDEGWIPPNPRAPTPGHGLWPVHAVEFPRYAVDFNGNGHTNLWDPVDAIGSVANYFKAHGWEKGQPVAVRGQGQLPGYEHGFQTRYPVAPCAVPGWPHRLPWQSQGGEPAAPGCRHRLPVLVRLCRTSTPSPATTTAPTTPWRYGSLALPSGDARGGY